MKDHVLYDSIYIKCENRQIYGDRKLIIDCQGLEGVGEKQEVTASGYGVSF